MFKEYIMSETLTVNLEERDNLTQAYDLNGHTVYIDVERKEA